MPMFFNKTSLNNTSPESSINLLAGIVLDNSILCKFSKIIGISDANSGPFLIFIENCFSSSVVSHWTKPGIRIKLYSDRVNNFKISFVIFLVRNAEIDTGASFTSILCCIIDFTILDTDR